MKNNESLTWEINENNELVIPLPNTFTGKSIILSNEYCNEIWKHEELREVMAMLEVTLNEQEKEACLEIGGLEAFAVKYLKRKYEMNELMKSHLLESTMNDITLEMFMNYNEEVMSADEYQVRDLDLKIED